MSQVPDGALVGSLSYNLNADSSFGKNSTCKVEVGIKRLIDRKEVTTATLFTMTEKQNRLTLFNAKIKCGRAENKIQRNFPNCKLN